MSAAPSLQYATGNTPRPTARRYVICLRITAAIFLLLAILVAWNVFSYFGIQHHERRGPRKSGITTVTLEVKWQELWKAAPVFGILAGFSGAYLFLARRASRGSETGIFAAGVMSMILTLVSALWLLTLFVYGAINVSDAKLWWESVLSVLMIGMSVAVIPWMGYVTIMGFDQMRNPRVKAVEFSPGVGEEVQLIAPPAETAAETIEEQQS